MPPTSAVTEALRRLPAVVLQPFASGEADQPAVGQRLRPEFGLAVDKDDIELRRHLAQVARRGQPAPAATDHDDTAACPGCACQEWCRTEAEGAGEEGSAFHPKKM